MVLRKLGFFAVAAVLAMSSPVIAGGGKGGSDNAAGTFNYPTRIEMGVNYPGDKAYPFGTTRVAGPDQGPYVQRCAWSAAPNQWLGFFFPDNVKMTCVRYTEENTK
jgi:hypothetical protein